MSYITTTMKPATAILFSKKADMESRAPNYAYSAEPATESPLDKTPEIVNQDEKAARSFAFQTAR
jgi:hypothetical protein